MYVVHLADVRHDSTGYHHREWTFRLLIHQGLCLCIRSIRAAFLCKQMLEAIHVTPALKVSVLPDSLFPNSHTLGMKLQLYTSRSSCPVPLQAEATLVAV